MSSAHSIPKHILENSLDIFLYLHAEFVSDEENITKTLEELDNDDIADSLYLYIALSEWLIHHGIKLDMDSCLYMTIPQIIDYAHSEGCILDANEYEKYVDEMKKDLAEHIQNMIDLLETTVFEETTKEIVREMKFTN